MQNFYKHLLVVLVSVLIISPNTNNTFGQQSSYNNVPEDSLMLDQVHYNLVKKLNATNQNGELRNHVIERQDLVDGQWQNTPKGYEIYKNDFLVKKYPHPGWYYIYEYDLQGRIIRQDILNRYFTLYSYDENGNLIESLIYRVSGDPHIRISYQYDENNFLISSLQENWYNETWNNSYRYSYTNNENGQVIERIGQSYITGVWDNSSKESYIYDENQLLERRIRQGWSNDAWVNFYRYLYINNQDGLVAEYFVQNWVEETWEFLFRETYIYNENAVLIESNYYNRENIWWKLTSKELTTIVEGSIIALVSPHDGEEFTHDASVPVQWIANGLDDVNIEFSSDNGNSWTNVESNVPDTGTYDYNWSIPFIDEYEHCKIRVSDAVNPSIIDEMEGSFSVISKGGAKGDGYAMNINNLYLPFNSRGVIADVNIQPFGRDGKYPGGEGSNFLFSSGFFLSGMKDGEVFTNAVASGSLVEDYLQGTVTYGTNDPRAQIYVVSVEDKPFGVAWQKWATAVELGAEFYDGDGDGEYNPVDLNGNSEWDPDEDRPDLIGDETAWVVYWDALPAGQRRWNTVDPIGIEVRQSIFGFASDDDIKNMLFIRYKLKYVGLGQGNDADKLTDCYFGVWADPDLGDATNDLVGADIGRNAGYVYNDGNDNIWGSSSPVFLIDFLSGPLSYVPGETFEDIDGDGEYTDGVDIPLDTAYSVKGQIRGVVEYPGAKNLGLTSFVQYINGDSYLRDPDNKTHARNYMLGKDRLGLDVDPCNWAYGDVLGGVDCATVNPNIWYNGDPVTQTGWVNVGGEDVRMMQNSGPFNLKPGEENEIMVAYVVGQGSDAISSITEARRIDDKAQTIFDNNFDIITSVGSEKEELRYSIKLYQNYPNPFNPTTKIKYEIPKNSLVQIVVYDILGRKVTTLVNEQKPAGSYEVEFIASQFSSGVYFYELRAGDFRDVKKLILLK